MFTTLHAHVISRPSTREAVTRREGRQAWLRCSEALCGRHPFHEAGGWGARHTERERGALQGRTSVSRALWEALPSQGTDRESVWLEGRMPEKPVGNNGSAINQSRPRMAGREPVTPRAATAEPGDGTDRVGFASEKEAKVGCRPMRGRETSEGTTRPRTCSRGRGERGVEGSLGGWAAAGRGTLGQAAEALDPWPQPTLRGAAQASASLLPPPREL